MMYIDAYRVMEQEEAAAEDETSAEDATEESESV